MGATITDNELKGYHERFDQAVTAMRDTLAGITPEQARFAPAPKKWSIAEILEHLIVTARKYEDRVPAAIEKARAKNLVGQGPHRHRGRIINWLIKQMAESDKPFRAPRSFRPVDVRSELSRSLDEYERYQRLFQDFVERSDGLDLARVRFGSPVTRLMRLSLGQGYELILVHQERHRRQIERVIAGAGFPNA